VCLKVNLTFFCVDDADIPLISQQVSTATGRAARQDTRCAYTKVSAQYDKMAMVVGRTKLTILATVDVRWMMVSATGSAAAAAVPERVSACADGPARRGTEAPQLQPGRWIGCSGRRAGVRGVRIARHRHGTGGRGAVQRASSTCSGSGS